ncbi:MAG TPA: type VII secretion integral membrane protein EccD [Pseudonocardiaceae bacterium]|jgi:type VII secretion integral membrane protein EccD|nr:type VII secretion integral membrane protein EccD [Pseudonocardiaceae bacterium]
MATRFTRVTVVGEGRQVDVSLPAQQPVLTLVPQLCALLSLRAERPGAPWTLATVTSGILDPHRTLDDAGVTDADVLYLAPPAEAPQPPFVEDVVDEVGTQLDNASQLAEGVEWQGTARVAGCCALAAAVLAAVALLVGFGAPDRLAALLGLAGLGLLTAILCWPLRDRGAVWLAAAGALAWALAGWTLGVPAGSLAVPGWTTAIGAGIGLTTFWLTGPRWHSLAAGGLTLAPLAFLGAVLQAGLPAERTAAVMLVVALFVAGLAPQFAVAGAELVPLLRAVEEGNRVTRRALSDAVRRGQVVLTGVVTGNAVVAALAVSILLSSGAVAAATLGALGGVVFGLRSRAFTRAAQVLPMLAVPTAAAAAAVAVTLPGWAALPTGPAVWFGAAGLLVVGLALVGLGVGQLGEVPAARLRRLLDIVEAVAVIAVVPLTLGVFDAYAWVSEIVS